MRPVRSNLLVSGMLDATADQLRVHEVCAHLQCWTGFDPRVAAVAEVGSHPFDDGQRVPLEVLDRAITWGRARLDRGDRLLVSCAAGRSRSPTVAMGILARQEHLSFAEAFREVIGALPGASPHPLVLGSLARLLASPLEATLLADLYAEADHVVACTLPWEQSVPWEDELISEAVELSRS